MNNWKECDLPQPELEIYQFTVVNLLQKSFSAAKTYGHKVKKVEWYLTENKNFSAAKTYGHKVKESRIIVNFAAKQFENT